MSQDPHRSAEMAEITSEPGLEKTQFRYRRLRKYSILLTSLVALTPLIAMTIINIYQYQKALKADMLFPILRQVSNTRHSLSSFIVERQSALELVIREIPFEELRDQERLAGALSHMKESFGGFVDLGLIDSKGDQVSYVGPYNLAGKNYKDQDWFHEAGLRGVHVSDVFMGHRGFPHFVIAVVHGLGEGDYYVLRATIDSDMLYRKILTQNLRPTSDAFLVNKSGILQTPSRFYGAALEQCSIAVPSYSTNSEVVELKDSGGKPYFLSYAYIEDTPFILMETIQPESFMENWLTVRNNLIWFLSISVILILMVIVWGSYHMVGRIREADLKRATVLHQIEYTNKMASIGRVAAGVAHEINNPMAIINENAGMVKDILSVSESFPLRDKMQKHVDSILTSVERCSRITHRLLGFAKRMDPHIEEIDLDQLLKDVLGFIGKEALHRNITVNCEVPGDMPKIKSDKGQLQQVLLNILNNGIEAVGNGGRIDISAEPKGDRRVEITISDDGPGISRNDLDRIFEPFFTTKKEHGTGLGLSITYGIVQKLGGQISVKSSLGAGTSFTVALPIENSAIRG